MAQCSFLASVDQTYCRSHHILLIAIYCESALTVVLGKMSPTYVIQNLPWCIMHLLRHNNWVTLMQCAFWILWERLSKATILKSMFLLLLLLAYCILLN